MVPLMNSGYQTTMARAVKDQERRRYDTTLRRELAGLTRQRILDAARRLLVEGTYSRVTMEEIANRAGVAYQTLYAIFRTKLRLAEAIMADDWPHLAAAIKLLEDIRSSSDPEVWLSTVASMSRKIYEPCVDLIRFTRESGDPTLLAHYRNIQRSRFERLRPLGDVLAKSGRLQARLTGGDAVDIAWSLSGPDHYIQLVFDRGWDPQRYEAWLSQTLVTLLLAPSSPRPRS